MLARIIYYINLSSEADLTKSFIGNFLAQIIVWV